MASVANRTLYVHNIPWDITEDQVREHFEACGKVESVQLHVNTRIGPNAKFAFVQLSSHEEALAAIPSLTGSSLRGRTIRVEFQRNTAGESREERRPSRGGRERGRGSGAVVLSSRGRGGWQPGDAPGRSYRQASYGRDGKDDSLEPSSAKRQRFGSEESFKSKIEGTLERLLQSAAIASEGVRGPYLTEKPKKIYLNDLLPHYVPSLNSRAPLKDGPDIVGGMPVPVLLHQQLPQYRNPLTGQIQQPPPPPTPPPASVLSGSSNSIPPANLSSQAIPTAGATVTSSSAPLTSMPSDSADANTSAVNPSNSGGSAVSAPSVCTTYLPGQVFWTGELARNKKKEVKVIATVVSGNPQLYINPTISTLNVSHRSRWDEVKVKSIHAACFLEVALADMSKNFDEYIEYFRVKARAGVASLDKDHYLYLIPPGVELFEQYRALRSAVPLSAEVKDLDYQHVILGLVGPSQPNVSASTGGSANEDTAVAVSSSEHNSSSSAGGVAGSGNGTSSGRQPQSSANSASSNWMAQLTQVAHMFNHPQ